MKWTVTWNDKALDDLAAIWLTDPDRKAITKTAHDLEAELRNNAHLKGQPFYGDRMIEQAPLAIVYELIPADGIARITQVMRIKN